MMKRRNFLGKLLYAIPGIGLLSADSFGKEKSSRFSIEKALEIPKGERMSREVPSTAEKEKYDNFGLEGVTWNYVTCDTEPITYVNGKPIRTFLWEMVSGEHITFDGRVYKITKEENSEKYIQIHPATICRCNVRQGWIEYARILPFRARGATLPLGLPERDLGGRIILRLAGKMRGLTVNLLDSDGNVITTLKGE